MHPVVAADGSRPSARVLALSEHLWENTRDHMIDPQWGVYSHVDNYIHLMIEPWTTPLFRSRIIPKFPTVIYCNIKCPPPHNHMDPHDEWIISIPSFVSWYLPIGGRDYLTINMCAFHGQVSRGQSMAAMAFFHPCLAIPRGVYNTTG